jgi:His/Glu/Gln/Arg/opine family amino acid ABC transporter permease subunit
MDQLIRSAPILIEALGQTLLLSVLTMVFAGCAGFVIGEASTFAVRTLAWMIRRYIELIRGIPLLVFIFLAYYMLPWIGIETNNFVSAVICLSLYFSGFVAEIVRGAIQSVPSGQIQSGLALGMRRIKLEKVVVLPQAIRIALPALLNLSSIIIKSTSIVSIIGVWELTYATREIVLRTVLPFQFFVASMIIYFVVCYSIVRASGFLERRMARAHR